MEKNCINTPRAIVSTIHAEVDLMAPTMEMIEPVDLALAMTRIHRYNGLSPRPFNLVQHTMLCDLIALDVFGLHEAQDLLYITLHDAHEAYTGDIGRPIKHMINEAMDGGWDALEGRLDAAIFERFGLDPAYLDHNHPTVKIRKEIDNLALAVEVESCFPEVIDRWEGLPPAPADMEGIMYSILKSSSEDFFHGILHRWKTLSPKLHLEQEPARGTA